MFSFLLSAVGVPNISNLSAPTTTNTRNKKRNNKAKKAARKKNNKSSVKINGAIIDYRNGIYFSFFFKS